MVATNSEVCFDLPKRGAFVTEFSREERHLLGGTAHPLRPRRLVQAEAAGTSVGTAVEKIPVLGEK